MRKMNITATNEMKPKTTDYTKQNQTAATHTHISVCALLLCAALGCTACAGNAPDTNPSEETKTDESGQNPDNSAVGDTQQSGENTGQEAADDTGASGNDTNVISESSNIRIEMQKEEDSKITEDGIVYYTRYATYPVITMEGNVAAAEKINAHITSLIDESKATSETEEWAEELLQDIDAQEEGFTPIGYSDGLTFETVRADSNVISFRLLYESYSGGAHGNQTARGVNYNAKTGELIAFSDLSDDPVAFREDTLAYNQALAKTDSYAERMFSEDDVTNGSLESVLYADDVWYLSASGLVFMSDPYALGPYAAGIIEFIIPYGDLTDMGFKAAYLYPDRFVLKMQPHGTYSADLNGDGADDSILIYSEDVENEDGTYNSRPHLIINDTDFAIDGADGIREQLEYFAVWAEPVLYDLDTNDAYIELAYVSWNSEAGDDYGYYSSFYRYTEDHTLVYLGRVKGDVNDPTVDVSALLP